MKQQLKALLFHLAEKSESPGTELQLLLDEVITELYFEVKAAYQSRSRLKLVGTPDSDA